MVQAFFISGTPLSSLSFLRSLFERDGFTLTDFSTLAAYTPRIEEREFAQLKTGVSCQCLAISSDGTLCSGEAINFSGRWCTDKFSTEKRLLRFVNARLNLQGGEIAPLNTHVLCAELVVEPDRIVRISRVSVLVNWAACPILNEGVFSSAENQLCITHT